MHSNQPFPTYIQKNSQKRKKRELIHGASCSRGTCYNVNVRFVKNQTLLRSAAERTCRHLRVKDSSTSCGGTPEEDIEESRDKFWNAHVKTIRSVDCYCSEIWQKWLFDRDAFEICYLERNTDETLYLTSRKFKRGPISYRNDKLFRLWA